MYYFGFAPHFSMKKLLIEGFNDVVIIILSYHLFLFTWFVEDLSAQYYIGQSFIMFFLVIIFVNLCFMMNNVYHRCVSKRRKKRYQKAYVARFTEFKARIEIDKAYKAKFNLLKIQAKEEVLTKYSDQISQLE